MRNRMAGKAIGALGALGAAAALSGCADLMVKAPVAPAWFQAKAVEVKGEGYPDIHSVPKSRGTLNKPAWDAENATLKTASAGILSATSGETPTPDEIRATEALLRAQVEQGGAAKDGTKQ